MDFPRKLSAALVALLLPFAPFAAAQNGGDFARLSSQYASWAGGKSNADAIVAGLKNGAPVTLVTSGPQQTVSLAGFTPAGAMTYGEVRSALAEAQQTLGRMGITRPTAEQIQAALIGGDIAMPSGGSRQVVGVVPSRAAGPVASR